MSKVQLVKIVNTDGTPANVSPYRGLLNQFGFQSSIRPTEPVLGMVGPPGEYRLENPVAKTLAEDILLGAFYGFSGTYYNQKDFLTFPGPIPLEVLELMALGTNTGLYREYRIVALLESFHECMLTGLPNKKGGGVRLARWKTTKDGDLKNMAQVCTWVEERLPPFVSSVDQREQERCLTILGAIQTFRHEEQ